MHSAQELVSQIEALTSLPDVYARVREQLESPTGSIAAVARLVAADAALSARLLHLVNSPLFGQRGRVENVSRAVTLLGLQQVHDLVLAMSLQGVFTGIRPARLDMQRFWRSSLLTGLAARAAGIAAGLLAGERLFVIGVLADTGHLVMYQTVPELAAAARREAEASGEPLDAAERRLVGCDFAELGAALMDRWQLPERFTAAVGAQVLPRLGGAFAAEAAAVNLARRIAEADAADQPSSEAATRVAPETWALLGLEPERLAGLREGAELDFSVYLALFFPGL